MRDIVDQFEYPIVFDAEGVGRSMREMAVEIIDADRNSVVSRWYQASHFTDLYVWEDSKNNVIKQQLHVCGQIVEWNIIEGVRTGFVMDESGSDIDDFTFARNSSNVVANIKYDTAPMATSIAQAQQILQQVGVIDERYKASLIDNFVSSPIASEMDPSEFLQRYGVYSPPEDSFDRLRRFIASLLSKFFNKN